MWWLIDDRTTLKSRGAGTELTPTNLGFSIHGVISTEDEPNIDDGDAPGGGGARSGVNRLGTSTLRTLATHPRCVQSAIWSVVLGSTAVGIWLWLGGFLHITDVGYLATFYLNLVGAATIILPLPGVLAACVAAEQSLGLSPVLIGVVGSAGATIGETTAYLAGFAGHNVVTKLRWYPRIHKLMERNGAATLFVVSAIPTPFFDLAGIAAGALKYPFKKFWLYVFAGKLIRLTIMAYTCRWGIEWVVDIYELNLPFG